MLYLCHEPLFQLGIFSAKFAEALVSQGVCAECRQIGSDGVARFIHRVLPIKKRPGASAFVNAVLLSKILERRIRRDDVVVVYETQGIVSRYYDCAFQRAIKRKGAKYVAVIQDAWPISYRFIAEACATRVALADLTLGVTPNLTRLLANHYPAAVCDLFEEPIDTTAFRPEFDNKNRMPVVVWSGPPYKTVEIERSRCVLEYVYKRCPFVFRIMTGTVRPDVKIDIPFEWMPFSLETYGEQYRGAEIAIARYNNDNFRYGECKGNYKVKTYMAAGCATITDPAGYNNDLIRHGENGLLAKTDDEWKAGLLHLLSDGDHRSKMRKAARESCVARFSYHASALCLMEVLSRNGILPVMK